jgi:hypothetical protein
MANFFFNSILWLGTPNKYSKEKIAFTVKVPHPDKFGYQTAVLAYNLILITGRPI